MFKLIAAAGLGALVALSSYAVSAQTMAPTTHHQTAHRPTGSHRSEMRARRNVVRERSRAGAEHARKMRTQ
jgi:hypothetical protein